MVSPDTEVVMLHNRSEVFDAFKNYKHRVEKETGYYIKKLRTDNGNTSLRNFQISAERNRKTTQCRKYTATK